MFNLVMVVIAIGLTALVVAGGAGYMTPDWGLRRVTAETATLSYQSFDSALSAYRASNGGSLPPAIGTSSLSSNALPWPLLRPYLGARAEAGSRVVSLAPVAGMDWYYLQGQGGQTVALCLASTGREGDPAVPPAVRKGLAQSAQRASVAYVGASCLERDASAISSDGRFAVTYLVQSGQ